MASRSFKKDYESSKQPMVIRQWDTFWKATFSDYTINREVPLDLDKMGVDLILINARNQKMLIDEKITHEKYPYYPIEIISNAEMKHDGWGYTSKGFIIAIAKHDDNYLFSKKEPPIFFTINDKFKTRILQNPNFKTVTLSTDGLYHSIIKRVPKEYLVNFENDVWWDNKQGKGMKLWMY